jgi:bifunctional non-homologous end joining protein LigD
VAEDLLKPAAKLKVEKTPSRRSCPPTRPARSGFVRPELVAEVEFRAWTADGLMRHASFRGLREDKAAREVVRESQARAPAEKTAAPRRPLTHPDRLYWEDAGVTKLGSGRLLRRGLARIGPYIVDRPLAVLRCPSGVGGQCFFQKHAWRGQPAEILKPVTPRTTEPIIAIDGLPGLLGLVQGGVLEIHPWGPCSPTWSGRT